MAAASTTTGSRTSSSERTPCESASPDDAGYAIVSVSVASMRAQASHRAELTTQALMGTPVRVEDARDGWCKIRTPDDYVAWAEASQLVRVTQNGLRDYLTARRTLYLPLGGLAYADRERSETVCDLVAGSMMRLEDEESAMVQVQLPDGRAAYVPRAECMELALWQRACTPAPARIVATAYRFMGVPYLWGGTSPKFVDCSGFTKMVFYLNGVILPRDAAQQASAGREVDTRCGLDALEAADLLFFAEEAEAGARVTHVGLYVGDQRYVHASGVVQTSSFDRASPLHHERLARAFVGARRILGAIDGKAARLMAHHPYFDARSPLGERARLA